MATHRKQLTAADCARQLLGALHSGSDENVRQALDQIVSLSSFTTGDVRELEFRDLLAGIADPIARGIPEFLAGDASSSKEISVQMLAHVASDGRLSGAAA